MSKVNSKLKLVDQQHEEAARRPIRFTLIVCRFHAREASASRHRSTSLRMLTLPVRHLLGLKSRA